LTLTCWPKYKDIDLDLLAEKLKFLNRLQLLTSIGRGDTKTDTVIRRLLPDEKQIEKEKSAISRLLERARGKSGGVRVAGLDNIMISFGKCCNPVPGEPITGIVSKGRGIVVHTDTCKNLLKLMQDKDRIVDVSWAVDQNQKFIVGLHVVSERRKKFLSQVSEALGELNSNIIDVNMTSDNSLFNCDLTIDVVDLTHLQKIRNRIKKIPGVLSVERINNRS